MYVFFVYDIFISQLNIHTDSSVSSHLLIFQGNLEMKQRDRERERKMEKGNDRILFQFLDLTAQPHTRGCNSTTKWLRGYSFSGYIPVFGRYYYITMVLSMNNLNCRPEIFFIN